MRWLLQPCNISFQPSKLSLAPSFLILLSTAGGATPATAAGVPLSPVVGLLNRTSTGMRDFGSNLTFTTWVPPAQLPLGKYILSVTSPASGLDARTGSSAPFDLLPPYVWVASTWSQCAVTAPLTCGPGVSTRQVPSLPLPLYRRCSDGVCGGVRCTVTTIERQTGDRPDRRHR